MLVKDIMSTGLRTVSVDTPLIEVASLMTLYRFSGLPVIDEDNNLIGLIAEKDLLSDLFPDLEDIMTGMANLDFAAKVSEYKATLSKTVDALMTKNVKSVSPDMPILKAAILMTGNRFRRIPVTENGKLVGMLSLGDVHKAIFHKCITAKD